MRHACGVVTGWEPGADAHVCWPYRETADLVAVSAAFLAVGARHQQRLAVVARDVEALTEAIIDHLALLGIDEPIEAIPLPEVYGEGGCHTIEERGARYAARTDAALGLGYQGLRVIADVTPLAGDAEAQSRWEAAADEVTAVAPFAVLCAYDLRVVPMATFRRINHVHPHRPADRFGTGAFGVHHEASGVLALTGRLGPDDADALATALDDVGDAATMLEVSGLLVIDEAAREVLDTWVAAGVALGQRRRIWPPAWRE